MGVTDELQVFVRSQIADNRRQISLY